MGTSNLNIADAVKHLEDNAQSGSTAKCAKYVREALAAGGLNLTTYPLYAKNYGATLIGVGFTALTTEAPAKGDVAVIQNYTGGHIAGHICMYSGTQWISDFKQRDMWGGPGYRKAQPAYVIYRP
jgi:type VI secretion system secreted protein VgrG